MAGEKLEKMQLYCVDDEKLSIKFMFNPSELKFAYKNTLKDENATEKKQGTPKVSFAHPNPATVTLTNLYFDTYESGLDIQKEFVAKLSKSCRFVSEQIQRAPVYILSWGEINYMYCFVNSLDYSFVLFLPNGVPVRAKVNTISLTQVDPKGFPEMPKVDPNRDVDSRWTGEFENEALDNPLAGISPNP
ncbi:MAG: hypothetical protein ACFCU9_04165 [Cyanophyceae cyanobacterium]